VRKEKDFKDTKDLKDAREMLHVLLVPLVLLVFSPQFPAAISATGLSSSLQP
jgi:hypothetical protein